MQCANPSNLSTSEIVLTTVVTADVNYSDSVRWKCKDRRFLIRQKNSGEEPRETYYTACNWSGNFSVYPSDLECIISYCDNPIDDPNTNGANYDFQWTNNLIKISDYMSYPCKTNYYVEQSTMWKTLADDATLVRCNASGYFDYPSTWPQCSNTITCSDPGNSPGITRKYTSSIKDLQYRSHLNWKCDDLRKYIKLSSEPDSQLSSSRTAWCEWRKTFPVDGTDLVCVIHHCRHPHDDDGKHEPPDPALQLSLASRTSWDVEFNTNITYNCEPGTWIERAEPSPTQNSLDVWCVENEGVYDIPASWPNCTETVVCGQPPQPPVNGSRLWLAGSDGDDRYDSRVMYQCQHGSQFDTDGDGLGDRVSIDIRCQWDKQWAPHPFPTDRTPYPDLPPCIVTHCVEPFKIPEETSLEEVTAADTPINTAKQYRCKDSWGSDHTPRMFWESDRSQSTFEISCQDTGYFTWREWPVCLTDVSCSPPPPEVPSHSEYSLSSDDGTVTINSLQYPVIPTETRTTDLVLDSTYNHSLIPRNFMANLTYRCGSAREFLDSDGNHQPSQNMTCQWDKTWTPTSSLDPCDWVSCLKPPTPPKSTNLRVSDWFGETIDFGQQVRFVCERGYFFEDDSSQIDVKFTCQDGKATGFEDKRGFFDVPQLETEWPRCVLGET